MALDITLFNFTCNFGGTRGFSCLVLGAKSSQQLADHVKKYIRSFRVLALDKWEA